MSSTTETGPAVSAGMQRATWNATVGVAIALQWAVVLGFSGIAWVGFGEVAARSLWWGGVAVALPNALLAGWLTLRVQHRGTLGVGALLGGELLKLGLTVAALVIVVRAMKPEIAWLGLVVGVVAALKAQWLAVWVTRNS